MTEFQPNFDETENIGREKSGKGQAIFVINEAGHPEVLARKPSL